MALISALTMTMKNNPCLLLCTLFLAGLIHSSEEYGQEDLRHSYTKSFSSSSSSAHASAYSSSSSYSYGSGNNVPIIGPVPKATAAAVATASAGATSSAVANAHASSVAGSAGIGGSLGGSYGGSSGGGYGGIKTGGSYGQSGVDFGSSGIKNSFTSSGVIGAANSGGSAYGGFSFSKPKASGSYGQSAVDVGSSGIKKGFTQVATNDGGSSYGGASFNEPKGSSQIPIEGTPDKSFEKTYYQPVEEDISGALLPNNINEEENSISPNKPVFPGPNGSIYDYKIPSNINSAGGSPASGYAKETGQGTYNAPKPNAPHTSDTPKYGTDSKPCCKGPFPGPFGSIHDSKPASAVGTSVATSTSYGQAKHKTYPIQVSNPNSGEPSNVYTSQSPENNNYGAQSADQSSVSVGSGSYNKEIPARPSQPCYQESCTKTTILQKESPPITYLLPPVGDHKPITEIVKEEIKPQEPVTNYITPKPQYTGPKSQDYTPKEDSSLSQPGNYGVQGLTKAGTYSSSSSQSVHPESQAGTDYHQRQPVQPGTKTTGQGSIGNTVKNTGNPGYAIISQKVPQGTIVVGSHESDGTYGGFAYSGFSGSIGKYPKAGGIPGTQEESQNSDDEDRIVYISNPNEGLSYAGASAGSSTSIGQSGVNKGILVIGGIHEGPRGSPYAPQPFPKSKPQTISQDQGIREGPRGSPFTPQPYAESKPHVISQDKQDIATFSIGNRPTGPSLSSANENNGISSSGSYSSSGSVGFSTGSKVSYSASGKDSSSVGSQASYGTENNNLNKPAIENAPSMTDKPSGTYTTTFYIDLSKPSSVEPDGIKIYSKPDITKNVGNKVIFSGAGSGGYGVSREGSVGGIASVPTGSVGYGSSSGSAGGIAVQGHRGIPCNINGCGTPFRHYSNAVPSQGHKNINVHISSISPSDVGSYGQVYGGGSSYGGSFGGAYSTGGSYGGGGGSYKSPGTNTGFGASQEEKSVGYVGGSSNGKHGSKNTFSEDDIAAGVGGFLSSIFLDGGSGSTRSGSYAKAGGYANSGSYSKANSYASSSSYASASSGAYSSYGHH